MAIGPQAQARIELQNRFVDLQGSGKIPKDAELEVRYDLRKGLAIAVNKKTGRRIKSIQPVPYGRSTLADAPSGLPLRRRKPASASRRNSVSSRY